MGTCTSHGSGNEMFASVVIGKGKAVHALKAGLTVLCGKYASEDGSGWLEDGTEITCKACAKRIGAETAETLFTLETETETAPEVATVTEAPESLETEAPEVEYHPTLAYVSATRGDMETDEIETASQSFADFCGISEETETEPSDAEIFRMMKSEEIAETVLTGYTANEWIDVMLSTDTHNVDMSRGLAVERLYMTKQAARKAKREAAELARVERKARNAEASARAEANRASDAYAAMNWAMGALRTRGVIMTLSADAETVTVESLTWVKGEGDTRETVATFTVSAGMLAITETSGKRSTVTITGAIALFMEILPERSRDLMPRKFRDMLRVHANRAPSDITGNRAARAVDGAETVELTRLDLETYAATLESRADGLKVRTSGKRSMQGVKLTEAERRESDRARQAAYRAAKRARKMAESMAEFIPAVSA